MKQSFFQDYILIMNLNKYTYFLDITSRHFWMKTRRYIKVLSAGPLTSKFLKKTYARNWEIASSTISSSSEFASIFGAGPINCVFNGRMAIPQANSKLGISQYLEL